MFKLLRSFVLSAAVAVVLGANPARGQEPKPPSTAPVEEKKKEKTPTRGQGTFTVGKDTTYIIGPRDKNGFLDYSSALNERMGKGATPDNNATVLIWKALGPHPEGATMPPEFFKWLGMLSPPEEGDYFITLNRYLKEHLKIEPGKEIEEAPNQLARATKRPWKAKDFPNLAAWLKINEKSLAVVVEASKRDHYFSPLVPDKKDPDSSSLISARLPAVQKCRELASALAARAMLRLDAQPEDAWKDLLAIHRLGRLVGRGGTLIEGLVGIAIDMMGSQADVTFLDASKPDAKRIEACLRDLQKLPPLPEVADKIERGERFVMLETILMVDRQGVKYLESLSGGTAKESNPLADLVFQGTDWDPALRDANRFYDRLVVVLHEKERDSREKKMAELVTELKELKKKSTQFDRPADFLDAKTGPKARGKAIGNILLSLMVPAFDKVQVAADRSGQIQDNLFLAFALAWYQRDQGAYPKELKELAPKYLATVPGDVFSGKGLIYRPTDKGYLLYSVGANGKDEEGRGREDVPLGDDLSVRIPLPELPQK